MTDDSLGQLANVYQIILIMRTYLFILTLTFVAATNGQQTAKLFPEPNNITTSVDSSYNINKIVDILLALVKVELNSKDLDRLDLPDFQEDFKKKVGPIRVKGYFKGWSGWTKSLTSLRRTGDAIVPVPGQAA
ncbi:hypothetical protein FOCC_FOCC002094 [Frankliniella occidentalis]|nr:hypothetical protein FOCC_FOCC002094 [Frankliniella occidentalis]